MKHTGCGKSTNHSLSAVALHLRQQSETVGSLFVQDHISPTSYKQSSNDTIRINSKGLHWLNTKLSIFVFRQSNRTNHGAANDAWFRRPRLLVLWCLYEIWCQWHSVWDHLVCNFPSRFSPTDLQSEVFKFLLRHRMNSLNNATSPK